MKNIFYKYPECEPLKKGPYLCVCKKDDFKKFYQSLYFDGRKFNGPFEVVAFTDLSPNEAAKNAQI